MDEYTDAGGGYRHDEQIGVDIQKDGSAEYKDQIMKRKNIMLIASIMADTYSGISCVCIRLHLRARMEMVAVLLYRPPIIPETRVPDSRKHIVSAGRINRRCPIRLQ